MPAKYPRKENLAGNLYVTKRQENSSLFILHLFASLETHIQALHTMCQGTN